MSAEERRGALAAMPEVQWILFDVFFDGWEWWFMVTNGDIDGEKMDGCMMIMIIKESLDV